MTKQELNKQILEDKIAERLEKRGICGYTWRNNVRWGYVP